MTAFLIYKPQSLRSVRLCLPVIMAIEGSAPASSPAIPLAEALGAGQASVMLVAENLQPCWEFQEYHAWKPMSPHVNAVLLNFVGEAVAIQIEERPRQRRLYDILAKMQHRQWYSDEANERITVSSKAIRKVYIPGKDQVP